MFYNKYPYTDFHELNLDWILGEIRRLTHAMSDFEAANHIKPCGVWDITKQYEAWSVVTDGGKGYISTRPVPAGIAISNQDYWTEIVDYDAFWGTLNLRVQALENSMTTLTGTTIPGIQNDVSGLDGRLDTLEDTTIPGIQNDVSGLDGRLDTLEGTTIPGIQTDISLMKNKKVIFIADSYAGTSDFVTKVNSIMGWTADVDSFCNAVGGEGFLEGNNGNGFLDELQQHAGSMTADVRNSITDIMVIGGANDAKTNQIYGTNPMENHFIDFVNYAVANFPNARIHVGFIGFCKFSSGALDNRTQDNLERCAYHYKDMALSNGCSYMTNAEYTTRWLSDIIEADGLHPNTVGGEIIAQGIVNYIKGHGIITSISRYDCPTSSVIAGGNLKMVFSMSNNIACIELGQIGIPNFTGVIKGGDQDTALANRTHVADYQHLFVNRDLHALTWAYCYGGATPTVCPIDLMFQGTNLSAVALHGDSGGWKDINWTNGTFVLAPTTIYFDPIILA